MNRFRYVLEKELFRLYYTSFANINRDIYNLKLFTPESYKNIKSVKYVIHFLKKSRVSQEVTVTFRLQKNYTKIILKKHIIAESDNNKLYFPEQCITVPSNDACVEFTRFEDRFFVIKIADQVEGFITFGKDKEVRIDLEAAVKCYITVDNSFSSKDIEFKMKKPSMNKNSFNLKLTNQYLLNCCRNPETKKTTIFNIGTIKVKFTKFKATIHSIAISPKIKTTVSEEGDYYVYSDSQFIY